MTKILFSSESLMLTEKLFLNKAGSKTFSRMTKSRNVISTESEVLHSKALHSKALHSKALHSKALH